MVKEDLKKKGMSKEEEHFYNLNKQLIERKRKELDAKRAEQKKAELKAQHWMRCPKCGLELHTLHMRKVDVDACMSCGGFWLDKGELEKLEKQPMPGAVAAFLNWFKEERKAPGQK